jgi:MATE family multidrug resistance protein
VNKKILRLAVPNILSNLSVPLLSSVDTAVVGHLSGVHFLGAIAIGSMIFNFVYWGFGFLRMGTTGMTAQACGKKDNHQASVVFYRSLLFAVSVGLFLILINPFIADFSFGIINGSEQVETYARSYFDIRIFAAPATLSLYVFHGWFLGMQNAKFPLLLTVISNLLNIIFNLLFVYQFNMNSDGVALGTVAAQYIGLFTAIYLFRKKYSFYKLPFNLKELFRTDELKKYIKINFDIFLRTLMLIFVFSFFTAKSAEYNDDILAANVILLQLWTIMSYGIDGFAFASESLVGKYFGSNNKDKLLKSIRYSFIWGVGLGFLISVAYFVFDTYIIGIFTDNQIVIDLCLLYMGWTAAAPLIGSFSYIWDGIYIGATATKTMRNTMLFCGLVLFLPIFYFTKDYLGNNALWLSLIIFMAARGLTLWMFARKSIYSLVYND